MYAISEGEILREWSIGTLLKKVEHGFNFEILKKGGKVEKKEEGRLLSKAEEEELAALYYGER